jgi:predicted nucleic acid-binding protein
VSTVLVDTGVWYELFSSRDRNRERNKEQVKAIERSSQNDTILLPWPVMYETLKTKMVKDKPGLRNLEHQFSKPNMEFLPDLAYQEQSLIECFDSSLKKKRPLSLVDCLLRSLMLDRNLKIDQFATNNWGDFANVCNKREIEVLEFNA